MRRANGCGSSWGKGWRAIDCGSIWGQGRWATDCGSFWGSGWWVVAVLGRVYTLYLLQMLRRDYHAFFGIHVEHFYYVRASPFTHYFTCFTVKSFVRKVVRTRTCDNGNLLSHFEPLQESVRSYYFLYAELLSRLGAYAPRLPYHGDHKK